VSHRRQGRSRRLAGLNDEQNAHTVDERSKLLGLIEACHRVIAQLERMHAGRDNPFAERIRETCRDLVARWDRLNDQTSESHSRQLT
jgi:hypothetical protein